MRVEPPKSTETTQLEDSAAAHMRARSAVDWSGLARPIDHGVVGDGFERWLAVDAILRPGRQAALRRVRGAPRVDLAQLRSWADALGLDPRLRTVDAFADVGVVRRYGSAARLPGWLDLVLTPDDLHPVTAATRLYLDLIHLHPFLDGNGRLARLAFDATCQNAGWPTPDLAAIARFPKAPGRPARYRSFVRHVARLLEPDCGR